MSGRWWCPALQLLLLLAVVGLATSGESTGASSEVRKPNFLFILADDLRHFNPYDDPLNVVPIMQGVVRGSTGMGGAYFTNAHAQIAMCSPSRNSFMTGLRPDTTKLVDINDQLRGAKVAVSTIGQVLKANGYETYAVGKIFDGRATGGWSGQDFPRSWTVRPVATRAATWNRNVSMPSCDLAADRPFHGKNNKRPYTQCVITDTTRPLTLVRDNRREGLPDLDLVRAGIERLNLLAANPSKPWMLAVGFVRPHLPFVAPKSYFDKWPREIFLNNTHFPFGESRDSVYRVTAYRNQEVSTYTDWPKIPKGTLTIPTAHHARAVHSYLAASSFVDILFGHFLTALRDLPQEVRDNTVLLFVSDHGFHLNEHQFFGKKTVYEAATHVPLLIMAPPSIIGHSTPIRVNAPVELIDIAPTIYELAGITFTGRVDGTSLVPYFRANNRVAQMKAVSVSQFFGFQSGRRSVMSYTFAGMRYRCVFHWNYEKRKMLRTELYDTQEDPRELRDISKEQPEISSKCSTVFKLYNNARATFERSVMAEDFLALGL